MAKTNFTKVEGMLDEGLRKMTVEHLLNLTETSSEDDKTSGKVPEKHTQARLKSILTLQRDMKFLDKAEQEPYELFSVSKKNIGKYLKNPDTLTSEEWEEIKEIQSKVHKFRKEFEKNSIQNNNDDLIEQQRRSQVTKRFNINEKWLPLS